MARENLEGVWFFGLAGSGKTFASKVCSGVVKDSIIIDGDDVRKFVSFDLGYEESDRIIQVKRVLGLAKIAKKNNLFPIVSTVIMTKEVLCECKLLGIEIVELIRPMSQLKKVRNLYEGSENVVGKHITQPNLEVLKIYNDGDKKFNRAIEELVK